MPAVTLCPFCPNKMHPGRLLSHVTCKHKDELVEHNYIEKFDKMATGKTDDVKFVCNFDHDGSNHLTENYDGLKTFADKEYVNTGYKCCFACNKSYKCELRYVSMKRGPQDGWFSKGFTEHYLEYDGTKEEHDAKHIEELNKFIAELKKIQKRHARQEKAKEKEEIVIVQQSEYDQLLREKQDFEDEAAGFKRRLDRQQKTIDSVANINNSYFKKVCELSLFCEGKLYEESLKDLFNHITIIYTRNVDQNVIQKELNEISLRHYAKPK
jgi:hypothetical protein